MSYIDDVNAIAKCGTDAVELNAIVTAELALKKLKFNV